MRNYNLKNVVALGKFDGVHIGHRELILKTVSEAAEKNMSSLIYTVLPPDFKSITTLEEQESIIKSLGADVIVRQYLTEDFKCLSPSEFAEQILVEKLRAAHVAVGYNFRFGYERSGDVNVLKELLNKYGVGVTVIDCVKVKDDSGIALPVSSTRIRRLIELGKTDETFKCLGRYFSMSGSVSEGKHLGRRIGFPTVNFYPSESALVPKYGVYASKVRIFGSDYIGVTNVGVNPTVERGMNTKVETHILGYDGETEYGEKIRVELIEFLRCEKKFGSVEELRAQIESDRRYVYDKYAASKK